MIFTWEAMPNAAGYQIVFSYPGNQEMTFDVENTSITRYMESFMASGVYNWRVIVFDNTKTVICISGAFTFELLESSSNRAGGGDDSENGGSDSWSGWGGTQ